MAYTAQASREHFRSLQACNWLNDEIVNLYIQLLQVIAVFLPSLLPLLWHTVQAPICAAYRLLLAFRLKIQQQRQQAYVCLRHLSSTPSSGQGWLALGQLLITQVLLLVLCALAHRFCAQASKTTCCR